MSKVCETCGEASDYAHESTCEDCGAPHAHPGVRHCADRHACDVRALNAENDRRIKADRELVLAVDALLTRIVAEASYGYAIPLTVLEQHDKVRRLITSDLYQSQLGIRLPGRE